MNSLLHMQWPCHNFLSLSFQPERNEKASDIEQIERYWCMGKEKDKGKGCNTENGG